jgi:membrane protein
MTDRVRQFLAEGLWNVPHSAPWWWARAIGVLQFAVMTAEGFVRDQLLLRATSLAYFTVLSLIPIVAIVVAIASSVGIDGDFAEQIVGRIAAGAPDTQQAILEQIRNARFNALGGLGAALLLVTTVFGISNIERAFNSIWGVSRARSWGRRFPDYLAILMVVPLLATGLSIATGLKSQWLVQRLFEYPAFALMYDIGLGQLPWLVLSLAFALMFRFLPNTSVRFGSALLGGVVSGGLVLLAQDAYVRYSVGVARADALFGAFAQLPLLFVWIYIFWAIVLFGAEIAFAHQHLASYRREVKGADETPAEREAVALRLVIEVARAFRSSAVSPSANSLSEDLHLPVRVVRDVIAHLESAGIVAERNGDDGELLYSLGKPAEHVRVVDILAAVRGEREADAAPDDTTGSAVERLLSELDDSASRGVGGRTLSELLVAESLPETPESSGRRLRPV